MKRALVLHGLAVALVLFILVQLLPGMIVAGVGVALVLSVMVASMNLFIKLLVMSLALPDGLLTLGLFALAANLLMFALADFIMPGFDVTNVLWALLASLILSGLTWRLGRSLYPQAQIL